MGQKIQSAGDCDYCSADLKAVYYRGMYPQDEELLEIHCNTCRASWNADGTPRAIPSEATLERLGVLTSALEKRLPIATGSQNEWYLNNS